MIAPARARRRARRARGRRGAAVPRRDASTRRSRSSPCTTGPIPSAGSRELAPGRAPPGVPELRPRVRRRRSGSSPTTSPRSRALDTQRRRARVGRDRAGARRAQRRAGAGAGRLRRRFRGVLLEPARGLRRSRRAGRASRAWPCSTPEVLARGTEQLRADLASGAWDARHGHLRALTELDVGYRLIVAGD